MQGGIVLETVLSVVTDSFNPTVSVFVLAAVAHGFVTSLRVGFERLVATLVGLALVYGERYLARDLAYWPPGAVFSTHTAYAVTALTCLIAWSRRRIAVSTLLAAALGGYVWLVIWFGYHRPSDIALSALAVLVPISVFMLARLAAAALQRRTAAPAQA